MRIICWDLDGTILNTDRLFAPVDARVAEIMGVSAPYAHHVRRAVARTGFTFRAWFEALQMSPKHFVPLTEELEADLSVRAPGCIYPGVRELIETHTERHVLVTAGDGHFQRWKFSLLGLHRSFGVHDRHFVPRTGSKAQAIEPYLSLGEVLFVENLPQWHEEVRSYGLRVRLIRPRWPGAESSSIHTGDGTLWEAVDTSAELQEALRRCDGSLGIP
jgi:hypothetical protein